MWKCDKCGASNDDMTSICSACGAAKSVGRFSGSAMRNSAAYTGQTNTVRTPAAQPAPAAVYRPAPTTYRAGRGFIGAGVILTILLFVLTAVIAWRQYAPVSNAVLGLIFSSPAALTPFVKIPLYVTLSFAASLTAAVPGLLLIAAGKTLRQLSRIRGIK